ncbi:carbonic anhydrase [Streptomyces sp. AC550_RSS872]|uniref:carbonic anhydrase n=1 Tax=Streptomyces sp. AC550_RSS872 TaxID=2823689 RepID=UPI0027E59DA9|nr:carbonic anhydrase [Streptomyces sp. AC550_RSS872]
MTGSVEYGLLTSTSGTPPIVVLGHQRCGAIKAAYKAMKAGEKLKKRPGSLQAIAEALKPAYDEAAKDTHPEPVDAMIRIPTKQTSAAPRSNQELTPRREEGRTGRGQRLLLTRHRPRRSPHRSTLRLKIARPGPRKAPPPATRIGRRPFRARTGPR